MYGQLNMGNECTLQAFLTNLRRMCPDAEAFCICPDPRDVSRRHRIAALQMSVGSSPVTNGRTASRLLSRFAPLTTRIRAFRWAYSHLARTSMLVVAGTGIFEENIGLSRGWLFDLLTWCIAARLRRAYLAFVSIGAGPLHSPLARLAVKAALRLGHYVSYRDRFSIDYMASLGLATENHHIFPDLAFSLPLTELNVPSSAVSTHHRIVGVGIMDYCGQRRANRRTPEQYRVYLEKLAGFVGGLIGKGYGVKILGGDAQYDPPVLLDLKERLKVLYPAGGLAEATFDTVEDLISHLASVDAVVATRFHNLVLALMLCKPTISVSYHEKNEALMESFGLVDASQDVDKLEETELERQLLRLTDTWQHHEPIVRERLREFRRQLECQYRTLFLGRLDGRSSDSSDVQDWKS